MPWNNQSGGGGWKSGGGNGGGPWGQGPSGGGQPPDLEEMLKRGQDKVKQVMHGGGIPGPAAVSRGRRRLRRHRLAGVLRSASTPTSSAS